MAMAKGRRSSAGGEAADEIERALAEATRRATALAQEVAAADPPALAPEAVLAAIGAWHALPPADPQRASIQATAERWAARLTELVGTDAAYGALLRAYPALLTERRVIRVAVECGGLGCLLTITPGGLGTAPPPATV